MSRVSVLAGVCALMALSSGAARGQAPQAGSLQSPPPVAPAGAVLTHPQNGLPFVTRYSSAPFDRGLGLGVGTTSTPLRLDQSLAGSARLGISPVPVSDALAVSDALVAVQPAAIRRRGPGVALMIVGAAGVVTGLLLDESLITVLGAGTGLVGLYLFVR